MRRAIIEDAIYAKDHGPIKRATVFTSAASILN
jgi:hypothetical protein